MKKVLPILIMLALGCGALVWLGYRSKATEPFVVSGFVEAEEIRVGSRVGGRVVEVLVREGDEVAADQVLFRIEPFDLEERRALAAAELEARRAVLARQRAGSRAEEIAMARARRDALAATLAELEAGPRPAEISIARERLAKAGATLDLATAEHSRVTRLAEQGNAPGTDLDRAVQKLEASHSERTAAELELELLVEGTRAEEIARAQAAVAEAEAALLMVESGARVEDIDRAAAEVAAAAAQLAIVDRQMDELEVSAPVACTVEAIDLHPGDLVPAGAPSVALVQKSRLWVRAFVPEGRLAQVASGMTVPVAIDGLARRFDGRVEYIARQAEFTPGNVQTPEERSKQVFRIEVTLEDPEGVLRAGMMADVLFEEALAR